MVKRMFVYVILILALGFAAYVRLAPSDPARWHVLLEIAENRDLPGGVLRRVEGLSDLQALHQIVLQTPRTQVLAGDPAQGHVTYITRSALWGFPDYTTVQLRDGAVLIHARLRFGKSDIGVNGKRVAGWLAQIAG
ncbi:MAG: DUF1499 domain-containing protein [Pelagimonas sp.]|jgi:hypothetical protein|nr:DUF1499 domain-containing protein [Pelagimonas sp.]